MYKELFEFENNKRDLKLNPKDNFLHAMYNIMQHFGRCSVFNEYNINALENISFPKIKLTYLLGEDILKFNDILMDSNSYEKMKDNLDKMLEVFNSIYKYTLEH